ncbi:MAG: hypothetical protein HY074_16195 [Deltaproteobacteria bacterium]|nr:hypothetical protein [Deltaproteobacteria bacterium]
MANWILAFFLGVASLASLGRPALSFGAGSDPNWTPAPAPGVFPPSPPLPTRENTGCTTDLRLDGPGSAIALLPVRQQGPAGICTAEAAADLVDVWSLSHRAPFGFASRSHRTSHIMAAIGAASHAQRKFVGGVKFARVYDWIRTEGSCDQAALTTASGLAINGAYQRFEGDFNAIYDSLYESWERVNEKGASADVVAPEVAACITRSSFLSGVLHDFREVERALRQSTRSEFFRDLFLRACDSHLERPHLPKLRPLELAGNSATRAIDAIFNRTVAPQPIAIGYCKKVLTNPQDFKGLPRGDAAETLEFREDDDRCGSHYSTVVGRRWNGPRRRCEYLIRNSWGQSCDAYKDSGLDCDADKGEVWIDGWQLNRAVFEGHHLNEE